MNFICVRIPNLDTNNFVMLTRKVNVTEIYADLYRYKKLRAHYCYAQLAIL